MSRAAVGGRARVGVLIAVFGLSSFFCREIQAQSINGASSPAVPARPLITQKIDETQRTTLKGNTHPLARAEFDQGAAPANLTVRRMELVLRRSAEQETALEGLLASQQERSSPNYHKWLAPADFGKAFGPADSDIQRLTTWLAGHGFQQVKVANGRIAIEFSGTAGQVQEAFHTAIHKYKVNGEEHWANASDPSIPSALAPAIHGVLTLHNFPRRSFLTIQGKPVKSAPNQGGALPFYTFTAGQSTLYGLGPTDFATIYNVLPLWNAGIDGTGQTIAIVGETDIHLTDVENFRSVFGLPAKDPQIIVNGEDPGLTGDETEALLDVEWSGGVAKGATIDFVISETTEAALGVDLSALYIVDNDLAPVMSESYGICEATMGNAGNAFYNALWQQAAAEGITAMVAAGDSGSAGCDDFDTELAATEGLAVSGFASTPYNVAVGGTDFNQTAATASMFWSTTNNATTGASALSYIPETAWNDSCANVGATGCTVQDPLEGGIVAGSGGPSNCATQDSSNNCVAGYAKPVWQTGTGVPADAARDIPDVSLFASNGYNNSFYIVCEADATLSGGPCNLKNQIFVGVGGTSASSPAFAGIMALVNQKMASEGMSGGQGNANYVLYQLAAQNGASCNSSTVALTGNSCVFYDVTQGNNSVVCYGGTPGCSAASAETYGVLVDPNNSNNLAWETTAGYDLATGLGSVNAANLVAAWGNLAPALSATTLTNLAPTILTHGQTVNVTATVAPQSGAGTPTGTVTLEAAPTGGEVGLNVFPLANGTATGTTTLLPGGTYNVTAHYSGDTNYAPSDSAGVQVTVAKENSQTKETLQLFQGNGTFAPSSTIPYGSIFFLRSDVTDAAGTSCIPNPAQTGAACPSGSVGFTLNGTALDAGTYALNSQGYTEDQTLANEFTQLGNYTLAAQYSGDASFNASSATAAATVTQSATSMNNFNVVGVCCPSNNNYTMYSGQVFTIVAAAYTNSVLQSPTGTIAILQNGAMPPGAFQTFTRNGSFTGNYATGVYSIAILSTQLTESLSVPGTYSFTANYPGDAFYTGSQNQWPLTVTVLDTTFNIVTPIPGVTVTPGQSGMAAVGLAGVDNFNATVSVTCTLPAAMKEATCAPANVPLMSSATANLAITTTAPHTITAMNRGPRTPAGGADAFAATILAGVIVFAIPGTRRRRWPAALLLLVSIGAIASCGGSGGQSVPPVTDPGTPAGAYTVNVTATAVGITRTGTLTVTVQ